MLNILGITGPIFILIAAGFGAVHFRLLARNELRALSVFVVNLALPALLFKAMAQRAMHDTTSVQLLAAYAAGSLAVAGAVLAFVCLVQGRSLQSGSLAAMGASLANSAFIGYPVAQQFFGPAASAALAVYAIVETLIVLPLLLTLAELGNEGGGHWLRKAGTILLRLLGNPLILGILAGAICAAFELQLPLPLGRALDMLSGASAPVALFYIGGTLAGLRLKGMAGDIAVVMAGKLILHPLGIAAAFLLMPVGDSPAKFAAIANACMPMLSIYPILGQKYGQEGVCAATLVATTAASFFTVSAVLWLIGSQGL